MSQIMIQKWGNSQGIRLPKQIMESCELQVGDTLQVKIEGKKLILSSSNKRPRRSQYKLEDMLAPLPADSKGEGTDWGIPVGDEENL